MSEFYGKWKVGVDFWVRLRLQKEGRHQLIGLHGLLRWVADLKELKKRLVEGSEDLLGPLKISTDHLQALSIWLPGSFLVIFIQEKAMMRERFFVDSHFHKKVHETSKRDQFLIKLCSDFETACSHLMNHHLVSSLNTCLSEFLREEQCIVTQAVMEHQTNVSALVFVAYATQRRNKGRDMCVVRCFSCKAFDYIARGSGLSQKVL
uniref:Uncharacterized protein n=1 Tax=Populus alba TaxID=43335 RepID=A0A4U5Q9N2_POPAL|nr:hypothetical protein D5086_0000117690 [Populus alba]